MLVLGIRYLNGFVTASEPDVRERVEWPPHPARVFMALAAAYFQTGMEPAERNALRWLQGDDGGPRGAPAIRASETLGRAVVDHFVPVNDEAIWRKKDEKKKPPPPLQSAPGIIRARQPRTFARAWLDEEAVYLVWQDADAPDGVRGALETLCAKVTRLGHSSSLVQMWLGEPAEVGEANWVPDDNRAEIRLRVAGQGTLEYLERRYNREGIDRFTGLLVAAADSSQKAQREAKKRLKEEFNDEPPARLWPEISVYQGYARQGIRHSTPAISGSVFSPHLLIFALEPKQGPYRQLDLLCVLALAQRWREALLSHCSDVPEHMRQVISGHNRDGAPLAGPHLAFVPLAFVGHPHADGHLLGMGIAFPEGLAADDKQHVLKVAGRVRELTLGRLGVWRIYRDTSARPPWNMQPEAWTAYPDGAKYWSTVTPIAFDRHSKAKGRGEFQRDVAEMIAGACESMGLSRPRDVIVTTVSVHVGVPPAHVFSRLRRKDDSERRHAHSILVFDQPVRGPILLGAGRYRGYGLCRPILDGGEGSA
jgi:CRISPR-associated protein Csb2